MALGLTPEGQSLKEDMHVLIRVRAVKLTEKLSSNFLLKCYQNSNYIRI